MCETNIQHSLMWITKCSNVSVALHTWDMMNRKRKRKPKQDQIKCQDVKVLASNCSFALVFVIIATNSNNHIDTCIYRYTNHKRDQDVSQFLFATSRRMSFDFLAKLFPLKMECNSPKIRKQFHVQRFIISCADYWCVHNIKFNPFHSVSISV